MYTKTFERIQLVVTYANYKIISKKEQIQEDKRERLGNKIERKI